MHRLIHARRGITTAIGCAAAVAAAAGAAYAATGGFADGGHAAGTRIYACVATTSKTLKLTTARATCPNGAPKISWNALGPRGPRGKRGPAGPRGASGRTGGRGSPGPAGPQGATGSAGATGPQGPAGAAGANGSDGTNGTNGSNGATGPPGAPGPTGPAGPSGPTGPAGTLSSAYLSAYASTSTVIAPGSDFQFDTLQASSGIVASGAGNTTFTVSSAGEYLVTDGVAGANESVTVQLRVNGAGAGPTQTLGPSDPNTLSGGFTIILSLNVGDAITLVNTSGAGGSDDRSTHITIVRIA